jgi:hypothetical protein
MTASICDTVMHVITVFLNFSEQPVSGMGLLEETEFLW